MNERILVFIPTYNCEKQIGRVLEQFTPEVAPLFSQIIVLDNGSQDKTLERAQEAAEKITTPVTLIKNDSNYNLGGSIKAAFLYALDHNFDYMITLHGDDQANIQDMVKQLKAGQHRGHAMLIGARFHPQSNLLGYSWFRILGNYVLNLLGTFIAKRRIDDLIAGLNCYQVEFLRTKFFLPFPNNLTFDVHMLLYVIFKKYIWDYFPMTWRDEDQISNAKVFQQAWIVLKLFVAYVTTDKASLFEINKSNFPLDFRYPGAVIYTHK